MTVQNGAPLRLVVPWKYGFKSIKTIKRISYTADRPQTFWSKADGAEYGFWANVSRRRSAELCSATFLRKCRGDRLLAVVLNGRRLSRQQLVLGMHRIYHIRKILAAWLQAANFMLTDPCIAWGRLALAASFKRMYFPFPCSPIIQRKGCFSIPSPCSSYLVGLQFQIMSHPCRSTRTFLTLGGLKRSNGPFLMDHPSQRSCTMGTRPLSSICMMISKVKVFTREDESIGQYRPMTACCNQSRITLTAQAKTLN
jgi:hypothetical protein